MGTLDLPTMTTTKWTWNERIRDTCGRSPEASQLQIDHKEILRNINTLLNIADDTYNVTKTYQDWLESSSHHGPDAHLDTMV